MRASGRMGVEACRETGVELDLGTGSNKVNIIERWRVVSNG